MKKGHKHSTGQLILKAIQLIKKKLQDAGPFQDELIEQKYHKHFLQSIVCTHNMGSIATLGISTVYHGGVLMVRQNSKGIHSFDDYMFVLRLSVLLALWVLFSMSSRLSESRKIRVAVFVRRSIHVRFFLFMGELLFMDMHIERAQMMSMILTLAFSVTLNSYKEHIGFNGALAYAGSEYATRSDVLATALLANRGPDRTVLVVG
eukprot:3979-Hanusia_phi.AAC.6